jgi:Ca2+-binding EF-hand superfamily protein
MLANKDGNGKISSAEFAQAFSRYRDLAKLNWKELIAQFDENGDGQIDITEFKAFFKELGSRCLNAENLSA